MSSACRWIALLVGFWIAAAGGAAATAPPLTVCSDPNNLPFSNNHRAGFENRIAEVIARRLHRPLAYFWLPQRRGFIRNSLNANRCDLVMGVPAHYELLATTRSYYRSSYVFLSRRDRHLRVNSFDDPALKSLTIGIQITGDDYNNPPAAQALARRQIIQNVRGFTVYGDYSRSEPQRAIVDAVADGRVDIAVVWGPLGGYYRQREATPIDLVPIAAESDGPGARFAFDIAMGVRQTDAPLHDAIDRIIAEREPEIREILRSYGVPLR